MGDEAKMRLAAALAINSTLTEFHFDCNKNIRHLVDAHLDRNIGILEKKSASLFFMLLPSLSLDDEEHSQEATLSLNVSTAVGDQSSSSKQQRLT